MAKKKKVLPAAVEQVQPSIEGVAKNLVDRIYGPQELPRGAFATHW
jgi:hypothetical protein